MATIHMTPISASASTTSTISTITMTSTTTNAPTVSSSANIGPMQQWLPAYAYYKDATVEMAPAGHPTFNPYNPPTDVGIARIATLDTGLVGAMSVEFIRNYPAVAQMYINMGVSEEKVRAIQEGRYASTIDDDFSGKKSKAE